MIYLCVLGVLADCVACRSYWIWAFLAFMVVVVQLLGASEKLWIKVSRIVFFIPSSGIDYACYTGLGRGISQETQQCASCILFLQVFRFYDGS